MSWRDVLAAAGVQVNDSPGQDPDELYLAAYRKGRRDEAAARDIEAATFEDNSDGDPGDDPAAWPDAARWPGGTR